MSAKNIVLQPGPTDGSWSATTKVSIDGTKEYTQAGLVAYASSSAWAKVVVMRRPNGTWTTELGRQNGYANADLPANAQKAITLQMYARDGQLRGRYSLDDGTTWTEIGDGFDTSGLGAPSIGLAAYNGTGSETGTFEAFTVGEPPELPPTPPCETPNTPEAGYSMLFDGTDASLENWKYSGGGRFVRDGCTIKSVGGFGLMFTKQEYEAPYSLKLEWMMPGDDNSGIFVGFPDTGANTVDTAISQGEEIQIDPTDNPAQTTGAIYLEQAADAAARDAVAQAGRSVERVRDRRARRPHHRVPQRREDQRVARRRPERRISPRATSACRCTARATTCSSATCACASSRRASTCPARSAERCRRRCR